MKKKKKKILVFNWKMNPSSKKEALKLFTALKKSAGWAQKNNLKLDFILSPPAVYLDAINQKNKNTKIILSGQDTFYRGSGSVTGGTSYAMIKDLGAKMSIVGHWERRSIFGESSKDVSEKVRALLTNKMKAIVCVGEEERDERGHFADFLEKEIEESLSGVEKFQLKDIILAYEPVWAIGVGSRQPGVEEVEQSLVLIKKILMKKFGEDSKRVKILYGGSVSEINIQELSEISYLDGFLLGRASLSPDVFDNMIKSFKKLD